MSLTVATVDASVTVTGDLTVLEAARSQIAGTVTQAEVRTMPLNGRNCLDLALLVPGVSPTDQQQLGGSIGGPVAQDRTFYFLNVGQRRLDQTGLATIGIANVGAVNTRLAAVGYPGSPVVTGVYPNPVNTVHLLGKVDQQLGRDQFSVRYNLYDVTSDNSRGAGALNAPSASAGLDNRDQAVAFSNTMTLSERTVYETRAQFAHGDLKAPPTDPVGRP